MYGEATIHDHFDGSANCVECRGKCRLGGADLWATALVRAIFEAEAIIGHHVPYYIKVQLKAGGVDVEAWSRRAKETNKR